MKKKFEENIIAVKKRIITYKVTKLITAIQIRNRYIKMANQ